MTNTDEQKLDAITTGVHRALAFDTNVSGPIEAGTENAITEWLNAHAEHPLVGKFFHTTRKCPCDAEVAVWQGDSRCRH